MRLAIRRLPPAWKFPLFVTAVLVCVFAILLGVAHREVRGMAAETVAERLRSTAFELSSALRTASEAEADHAHRLARLPEVVAYLRSPTPQSAAAFSTAIRSAATGSENIAGVAVYDRDGVRLALEGSLDTSLALLPPADLASRILASPESATVGPLMSAGGSLVFPVEATVADGDQRIGLLVMWRTVTPRPTARAQIPALFGTGSRLIVGTPGGAWTDQVQVVREPAISLKPNPLPISVDGFLTSVVQDPLSGWLAVLQVPESVIQAPADRFLLRVGVIGLALVLVGGMCVWWLSRDIALPIYQVTEAAAAQAAGNRGVRIAVRRDDDLGRLATAFNQMADRVAAEAEARGASETQWRHLFKDNPHPMWVYDPASLAFLAVNDAAVQQYGYTREEFLQMEISDIRPPEHSGARLQPGDGLEALGRNLAARLWRHRRKDGTFFDVEVIANSVVFNGVQARLVLAKDVTLRTQLEMQLRQAQKMEAVGVLAGGVAHDFNNLLAVILTYTELVRLELPDSDPRATDLDEVKAAAERATALTRQLLAFSRQSVVQASVVDLVALVQGFEKMLRRLIGEDIEVETVFSSETDSVLADPSQLEQVLLNLAVNARDAMPTGGKLTIAVETVTVDEASRELHGLQEAGKFVVTSVSDTGVGMTPETRVHVFEPFFTTKEVGKGTGLGLATVYAIVTQAGGNISVYSEPGRGSTFRVYLPAVVDSAESRNTTSGPHPAIGGKETILLVEDDAAVRAAATGALTRLGYSVLETPNADSAFEVFSRNPTLIDLVISDVVMPGTDGPTLLKRLRSLRPGLKALLMSGYTGDSISSRGVSESGVPFLQKPFTVSRLGLAVRSVLDAK